MGGDEMGYDKLFQSWEQDGWSATAIDFAADADHWEGKLNDRQRDAALWNFAMFFVGGEVIARNFAVQLHAMPSPPERTVLATLVADEARHLVFLRRFLTEVVRRGAGPWPLDGARRHLTWGFNQVFSELDRLSEALYKRPRDRVVLAQNVAMCQVLIEGMLAIPGQQFFQSYVERQGILPGFAEGAGHVADDVARHVAFGIHFLRGLMRSSPECRSAVIELLNRVVPFTVGVFVPPGMDRSFIECFDFKLEDIYATGVRSLETRASQIEIDPEELHLLSRDDRSLSYQERAERMLVLIEAGVLGDDRAEPRLNPRAFSILFEGMVRSVDVATLRSLGGPLEWDFADAEAWHLVVTDGHVEARRGKAREPALRLEMASPDWARMVVGRIDSRWSLVTRKLRIHGALSARAKLPRLFK